MAPDLGSVCHLLRTDGSPESYELDGELLIQAAAGEDAESLCAAVALAFTSNITLASLSLRSNGLGAAAAEALATALRTNMRLCSLELGSNRLGPGGASALAAALRRNETLDTLGLANNGLTGEGDDVSIDASGVVALAAALRVNRGLTSLDMAGNCLTDYGENDAALAALLEAANGNPRLQRLDLGCNDLGTRGAELLRAALLRNGSLTELCLRDNHLRPPGAHAVAAVLRGNGALRRLDVSGNDLTDSGGDESGFVAMARSLEANSTLWVLDAGRNALGVGGATALARPLTRIGSHLTRLYKLKILKMYDNFWKKRANFMETLKTIDALCLRFNGHSAPICAQTGWRTRCGATPR